MQLAMSAMGQERISHRSCPLMTQSGHAISWPPRANCDGFTVPHNRRSADIQFPRVCTAGDQPY